MNAIPPGTTLLPSRTDITSATRGEKQKTQIESFDRSLTRSQREARTRDSAASDAPVVKPDREVKQRKTKTDESDAQRDQHVVDRSTAEPENTTPKAIEDDNGAVLTDAHEFDVPETESSTLEADAPSPVATDAANDAASEVAELLMALQPAASAQPVAATGHATAPVAPPIKAVQPQNHSTNESSTDTSVLASTGAATESESAGVAVVPAVATDCASARTKDSPKRVTSTIESTPNVQQSQAPAASAEANVAPAGSSGAPQATAGREAIAAQFAQLPTGDDSGLRDDANVARVVRGMTSAIHQRGGSVTLRLTPPELGEVKIEMTVRDGVVNAKFTAVTESVRHLLTDQMAQLRSALDRQGLSVERIEVQSPAPQQSGSGSGRSMDDAGRDGRSAGEYTRQGGQREGARSQQGARRDVFEEALAGATQ